ncbi:hypothetical protein K7459_20130 [Pseudomonas fluorescens]|uniref:Putative exported protein n=1 Tax=Pseudomonas fluorescens (strain Pf0-1) TaxID=205922 RepID=Q3KD00_PSEPF|nr:hypothetical protein [Pseudomonas fluorescens]ABA74355.1 putative exported protein [Pseudomonas fluorescens Pf0-1]MBY9025979.1 hypothetical protein [Pseudomonas fluorescens]MBY9031215.1 hypothetical protein [Pseudomonas fluorescens]MBY9037797.1 hypothetical protein [Pseudomonas fluorescens]MBY9041390.1 hypothetical protein [Pseudomonas fluorescens]
MNRFLLGIALLALSGGLVHADSAITRSSLLLAQSPTGNSNNPYNSPIRRANPNSMQGTQPGTPPVRGPNTVPVPRPPTLENRGIGNGQPLRSVPSKPPTFIPNPPARDSGSNR